MAVATVEAWTSVAVQCGRLVESLLHRTGNSDRTLARSLEAFSVGRNDDGTFRSSVVMAGHALRRIRNASAHHSGEEINEFEATLAVASCFIISGALLQYEPPEMRGLQGFHSAETVRNRWKEMAPKALCRWVHQADRNEVRNVVVGQDVAFYKHLVSGSMSQLHRVPQRLAQIGAQNDEFAEALIDGLPHVLRSIGARQANLLWRFVTYLSNPSLRPLRLLLYGLMPYDETWLSERLIRGQSISATTWRLGTFKRRNPKPWRMVGGSGDTLRQNAAMVWEASDWSDETNHQRFMLAYACPLALRLEILRIAPEEAVLTLMSRKAGYSLVGKVFATYVTTLRSSVVAPSRLVATLIDNVEAADPKACRQLIASAGRTRGWAPELSQLFNAILSREEEALDDTVGYLFATMFVRPSLAVRHVNRLLDVHTTNEWTRLLLLAMRWVYDDAHPQEDMPSHNIQKVPAALPVPPTATRLEIGLVAYALQRIGDERWGTLAVALRDLPSHRVDTGFARWLASHLSGLGIDAFGEHTKAPRQIAEPLRARDPDQASNGLS